MPSGSRSKNPRAVALAALRKLSSEGFDGTKTPAELFAWDKLFPDALEYKDRARAIVAVTNLELALETAILSHFVPLDDMERRLLFSEDHDSPLSSFAAKIRIGYALNIYGRHMMDDLNCLRSLRNAFAHASRHVDFSTPEIAAACDVLKLPQFGIWSRFIFRPTTASDKLTQTCLHYGIRLFIRPGMKPRIITEDSLFEAVPS